MAEELQLALLGNVEIRRAGVPVTGFKTKKAKALLCYLAVTGRSHARPTLAGLLWGELPETSAQNNLRKALTNLRQLVGFHLTITREHVAFNRDDHYGLDVECFEAQMESDSAATEIEWLQAAIELYRGDFLDGFYVRQAPTFEEWVLAQRARLRELALQALYTLAVHHTRRGETGHTEGIDYTTRLLALEPWREEAHRQLMLLLAHSGQRSAALAQYETCRQVLAGELGVEPGEETIALYERIRDGPLSRRARISEREGEDFSSVSYPPDSASPLAPAFLLSAAPQSSHPHPPFVARKRQLAQLNSFLDSVLAGHGRVVLVTGEAGSGKTVLVQEFTRRAGERRINLVVASGNCNAFTGVGDPYLPFREILALLTGDVEARLAAGAISLEQARRLRNLMPHSIQSLANIGPDLINIFISGSGLTTRAATAAPGGVHWLDQLEIIVARKGSDRDVASLKQTDLFEQYAKLLTALARQHPLVLVVDDLQWADAGSINLLFHLSRRLAGNKILLIGIYRPADVAQGRLSSNSGQRDRHPLEPVVGEIQRHFGQIEIHLEQSGSREFVESLLDIEPNQLNTDFRRALYQQTKGHAFFTVEILQSMQERGDLVQDEAGRWIEGTGLDWKTLPARVEGIIGERINRLPLRLKEILKVASVEGTEFTAEVAAQVLAIDEREIVGQLSSALDRQHRLVRNQGSRRLESNDQRLSLYQFRHILFQKHLYDSLAEAERAYLHEAIGNVLEQLYESQTEAVAIQLARHFQLAGLRLKAIDYLQQAGKQAGRSYAYQEAVNFFNEALTLLKTLNGNLERDQQELVLQIALGKAAMAIKGYAAPEVEQAYARARELCQHIGETPQLFPVLMGLRVFYLMRGRLQTARELGEQCHKLAQRKQDQRRLLRVHEGQGVTLSHLGEFVQARAHLERGIDLYDPQKHHSPNALPDSGVDCRCYMAVVLWLLGYPDQALKRSREALTLAQELSQPFSYAYALAFAAILHQYRREEQAVLKRAEEAITLSTQKGYVAQGALATVQQGWSLVEQGQEKAGIAQIRQGLAAWRETGAEVSLPHYLVLLADACRKARRVEEGLSVVAEALNIMSNSGERWPEAELYRLKGELLLQAETNDKSEVEGYFCQAIEVARSQQAKSLELRAVMSLGRLWHRQGKKAEARRMLAEIYNWFTEGFDTPDLKEAKARLEKLL